MTNKYVKAGILIALLVVPASVFIFLKVFGENKFNLPYFMPVIQDNGEVLISNGDTVFHQIPNFELINQEANTINSGEFKDKIYVVSFFFSRCGTVCPVITRNQKAVQEEFKGNERVKIVSISIDPKFDTPAVLKKYAQENELDLSQWHLLTGEKSYIYDLAIKGFKLPVADASAYDSTITNPDETFIHSEKLLLIDNKGFVRGIYDGTSKEEIKRLNVEIKVLLEGFNDKE
ncbi:MAG: SCO family protein [Spirosomataceae bacterium]